MSRVWQRPSGIPALLRERERRIRECTGPCRPTACCTRHHQGSLSQVRCKARTTTWGCALSVFVCACTHTDRHTLHKDNIKMNADQKTVEITTVKCLKKTTFEILQEWERRHSKIDKSLVEEWPSGWREIAPHESPDLPEVCGLHHWKQPTVIQRLNNGQSNGIAPLRGSNICEEDTGNRKWKLWNYQKLEVGHISYVV